MPKSEATAHGPRQATSEELWDWELFRDTDASFTWEAKWFRVHDSLQPVPTFRPADVRVVELQPGQECVLANIGGALVAAEIRAAKRAASAVCYRPLLEKLIAQYQSRGVTRLWIYIGSRM